jgi:hypothetical protein
MTNASPSPLWTASNQRKLPEPWPQIISGGHISMEQQAPPSPVRKRRQPTLAAVRRKCLECMNRDHVGYDCEIPACPLYAWQPWRGRPVPARERGR